MNIHDAIIKFLEHRRARRRSPATIEQYDYQLNQLWQGWRTKTGHALSDDLTSITVDQLAAFFHYLGHEHTNKRNNKCGLSPETINGAWRTLRGLWNFSARRGWLLDTQKGFFLDDEFLPRPAVPQRLRVPIDDDTLYKLLDACNSLVDIEERYRNRAFILILADSGMRISELVTMCDDKVKLQEQCAAIIGKGNREEWVFWHGSANRALAAYLRHRSGPKKATVFRRLTGEAMTTDDARKILKTLAEIAQVDLPYGSPAHSFRHRFAHKAIDSGLDITQVRQLMRHRCADTTYRYLQENKDRLNKMHKQMGESG